MFKIRLLKSFDYFSVNDESKQFTSALQFQLNKLSFRINKTVQEEFNVSVNQIMEEKFPDEIKDFEMFETHEQEHRQLIKIQKYVRKFLKTLIVQIIYDKFCLKFKNDNV